jgi:hypothetical protein
MKKIILLFACISVAILNASAQSTIKASSAGNYIGQQVSVEDSVYQIKVYNDSTAVVDLGGKKDKAALNVVFDFDSKFRFDGSALKSFKKSRISVTGFVVLVDNQPTIVLTDKQNLRFLPKPIHQKWLAISWIPYQKEPR